MSRTIERFIINQKPIEVSIFFKLDVLVYMASDSYERCYHNSTFFRLPLNIHKRFFAPLCHLHDLTPHMVSHILDSRFLFIVRQWRQTAILFVKYC